MKKFLLACCIALATLPAFSQSNADDDLAMIQSAWGKDKRTLVYSYMTLNDTQTKAFTPLYEAYEKQRRALAKERIEILKVYAARYNTLEDHLAAALATRTLDNDAKYTTLYKSTLKKLTPAIGGQNAAKFLQLEIYLQTSIRIQIQDQIPFIGELEKHRRPVE